MEKSDINNNSRFPTALGEPCTSVLAYLPKEIPKISSATCSPEQLRYYAHLAYEADREDDAILFIRSLLVHKTAKLEEFDFDLLIYLQTKRNHELIKLRNKIPQKHWHQFPNETIEQDKTTILLLQYYLNNNKDKLNIIEEHQIQALKYQLYLSLLSEISDPEAELAYAQWLFNAYGELWESSKKLHFDQAVRGIITLDYMYFCGIVLQNKERAVVIGRSYFDPFVKFISENDHVFNYETKKHSRFFAPAQMVRDYITEWALEDE